MKANDRLFDKVYMRQPGYSYPCANVASGIDLELARIQQRNYMEILHFAGIKVDLLPPLETHPDAVFIQDVGIIGTNTVLIGNFSKDTRSGEETIITHRFQGSKFIVLVKEPEKLEGGDVLVAGWRTFIGISQRTNNEGARQFMRAFPFADVKFVPVDAMHLMCYASYIGGGTILIAPEFVDTKFFTGYDLILVPRREASAANALYLGNKQVFIPTGAPITEERLEEHGYTPIPIDISEFQKADGSISCLCLPIYKNL